MTDEELIQLARETWKKWQPTKATVGHSLEVAHAFNAAAEALLRAVDERDELRNYKYQNEIREETLLMQSEDISQKEKRIAELERELARHLPYERQRHVP